MKRENFINEFHRMCDIYKPIMHDGCPANGLPCCASIDDMTAKQFNALYKAVEGWSDTHPVNTRKTAFLKLFPDVCLGVNGTIYIQPCCIDSKLSPERCERYQAPTLCGDWTNDCSKCTADYWDEIVEDDK